MAGEEDVELRDLVAQSLEAKGILGKIRAQLRASVFLALEEQETKQGSHPLSNEKLRTFLRTKEGQRVSGLVREFLEFFELEFTSAVFDPETNALDTYPGRDQLARDIGLDPKTVASSAPLLSSVLQRATAQAQPPPPPTKHPHFPEPPPPPVTAPPTSSGSTSSSVQSTSLVPPSSITDPPRTTASIATTAGETLPLTTLAATTVPSTVSLKVSQSQPLPPVTSDSIARGQKPPDSGSGVLRPPEQSTTKGLLTSQPADSRDVVDGGGKWPTFGPGTGIDGRSVPQALGKSSVNSSLDIEKLLGTGGSRLEKPIQLGREGGESSRSELDDFFDTHRPPSGVDLLSRGGRGGKTSSQLRSLQDGGMVPGGKAPGTLSSLQDAPSLPGISKPGASSLSPLGALGALGVGFDSKMGRLVDADGEYEEDFLSDDGRSDSVSEHLEDPSLPLSSTKLQTTDLTLSDSSLGAGEFDHTEAVQTQS